jgi:hypothetical protein
MDAFERQAGVQRGRTRPHSRDIRWLAQLLVFHAVSQSEGRCLLSHEGAVLHPSWSTILLPTSLIRLWLI